MKKKTAGLVIAGAVVIALAAFFGSKALQYRFGTAVTRDGILLVSTEDSYAQLLDSLASSHIDSATRAGFLSNEKAFERQAAARKLAESFKPGRYELKNGMTYSALINTLRSGRQAPVRVTFNNIRTMDRLAGAVSKRLEFDSLSILKALTDKSVIESYGYTPQTFMAMFIPNTYEFYWNTTPSGFLDRMQKESDRFWTSVSRDSLRARSGLSREQVMTLASIVYEETKMKSEMPRVAGVYINRLRRGMLLQADPTVKFALGDFEIRRVLLRHLEADSPYNTYKYAGLPPGPICMPSIDAIDAVLNYEDNDYLYFCAKADLSGAHAFAKTLAEHNRNAQTYSHALNRMGIR